MALKPMRIKTEINLTDIIHPPLVVYIKESASSWEKSIDPCHQFPADGTLSHHSGPPCPGEGEDIRSRTVSETRMNSDLAPLTEKIPPVG